MDNTTTQLTAHEISEHQFCDMLGALPPVAMDGKGFLLGEAYSHNDYGRPLFLAFFEINNKFYKCDQILTVRQFNSINVSEINIR